MEKKRRLFRERKREGEKTRQRKINKGEERIGKRARRGKKVWKDGGRHP